MKVWYKLCPGHRALNLCWTPEVAVVQWQTVTSLLPPHFPFAHSLKSGSNVALDKCTNEPKSSSSGQPGTILHLCLVQRIQLQSAYGNFCTAWMRKQLIPAFFFDRHVNGIRLWSTVSPFETNISHSYAKSPQVVNTQGWRRVGRESSQCTWEKRTPTGRDKEQKQNVQKRDNQAFHPPGFHPEREQTRGRGAASTHAVMWEGYWC